MIDELNAFDLNRYNAVELHECLLEFPAVVILGPRQVGKTTLARDWVDACNTRQPESAIYLDLELPSAQRQIEDVEGFFQAHRRQLVVLDEVQRTPKLFEVLRGVIDQRRREGEAVGQFLLLGSASGVLLGQSSESLAGRVATVELTPFQLRELAKIPSAPSEQSLWVRGGFPLSLLARNDAASLRWRDTFIQTYLERDIPALGLRIPATTLRRLWTMLAHHQGQMLNQSQLAGALGISGAKVTYYIDVLVDLMLVRRLPPWAENTGKRMVKSPKVYVRDCGVLHALLGLKTFDDVLAHPVAGQSWEGYVLEQLIAAAPQATPYFYRTSHGAEADLVLAFRNGTRWVFEIKRSSAPTISRGLHSAVADLNPAQTTLVAPVPNAYTAKSGNASIAVMGVAQAVAQLEAFSRTI